MSKVIRNNRKVYLNDEVTKFEMIEDGKYVPYVSTEEGSVVTNGGLYKAIEGLLEIIEHGKYTVTFNRDDISTYPITVGWPEDVPNFLKTKTWDIIDSYYYSEFVEVESGPGDGDMSLLNPDEVINTELKMYRWKSIEDNTVIDMAMRLDPELGLVVGENFSSLWPDYNDKITLVLEWKIG